MSRKAAPSNKACCTPFCSFNFFFKKSRSMLMHLLFLQTKGSTAKCMNLSVISECLLRTLCESKDLPQSQMYMLLNALTYLLCCKRKFPQNTYLRHNCVWGDGNNYVPHQHHEPLWDRKTAVGETVSYWTHKKTTATAKWLLSHVKMYVLPP